MIPAIQDFIKNPNDIDGPTKNIQAQKVSIFGPDIRQPHAAQRPQRRRGIRKHLGRVRVSQMARYKGINQLRPGPTVVAAMIIVPTPLVLWLVWLPAIGSVLLSFTNWNGIGPIGDAKWMGLKNYHDVVTIYPPFWPAVRHNPIWFAVTFCPRRPSGCSRGSPRQGDAPSRVYQTAFYLPVVLSLALVGFIWQLSCVQPRPGLDQRADRQHDRLVWRPEIQPVVGAGGSVLAAYGYIMLLYLAGLKGVDASLREAARVDGARRSRPSSGSSSRCSHRSTSSPVVSVIEALRAFDLVWVINRGRNGLELIATLVTQNIVGEASRIGFGSALATFMLIISSVFIAIYLRIVAREQR